MARAKKNRDINRQSLGGHSQPITACLKHSGHSDFMLIPVAQLHRSAVVSTAGSARHCVNGPSNSPSEPFWVVVAKHRNVPPPPRPPQQSYWSHIRHGRSKAGFGRSKARIKCSMAGLGEAQQNANTVCEKEKLRRKKNWLSPLLIWKTPNSKQVNDRYMARIILFLVLVGNAMCTWKADAHELDSKP